MRKAVFDAPRPPARSEHGGGGGGGKRERGGASERGGWGKREREREREEFSLCAQALKEAAMACYDKPIHM